MTTAVASPPSFQPISRLGWNATNTSPGGFNPMSADEVSRLFVPQRKVIQRTNSSSSIASSTSSNSSNSSTSTVTSNQSSSASSPVVNGDTTSHAAKKKPRGGFWSAKSEPTAALSNGRANGVTGAAAHQTLPALPSQNSSQTQLNGGRPLNGPPAMEQTAVLALLPMNGTFERKQINVPFFPDVLRVGRQTNAKTVPTPSNGYFDSKVLSRQHAELWAERNGKVWIRDVKSSNGTFVNGQRLSAENRDSEPHELRQHDTLELGIDIVSEDQKTIVHHKVSAKVEYVGLPGSSNNVMDLNFGDLDPSHGGPLLPSPMSQPMVHSRSRPGGPVANGRPSPASSVISNHTANLAQQRQINFWGSPLNVEQLVKTLSTEMKAARQQSQDLDQTSMLLNSILSPDSAQPKPQSETKDSTQPQKSNARARSLRLESAARFAEPPAPPPQQPLPEKPDAARQSPADNSAFSFLRRSETAKPPLSATGSPHSPQNSQSTNINNLIETLSIAKKELDSQGARVKHLEDMLRQERSAREDAEERARRLEQQHTSVPPLPIVENAIERCEDGIVPDTSLPNEVAPTTTTAAPGPLDQGELDLQKRLDTMMLEMQKVKNDMEKFKQRAETAEQDATEARLSLAEMIEKLRRQNDAAPSEEEEIDGEVVPSRFDSSEDKEQPASVKAVGRGKNASKHVNGHVRAPSRLPDHLERAMATVLRDSGGNGDALAQSAPYVSMLGVVLIGVGLMAYLNSWQKTEK